MSDPQSTYATLGIPEILAVPLALIALSLALAPWFGGTQIGPLTVPSLRRTPVAARVALPCLFLASLAGFLPIWSQDAAAPPVLDDRGPAVIDDASPDPMPPTPSPAGDYALSGRLGDYAATLDITLNADCAFTGWASFDGAPTGGTRNRLSGTVDGRDVRFTRRLDGVERGKSDRFVGGLTENGTALEGAWGPFAFTAGIEPALERCDPP
ncbi:MAG: hypothetical protein AAFU61_04870 [Pseudomonadota bacterium]